MAGRRGGSWKALGRVFQAEETAGTIAVRLGDTARSQTERTLAGLRPCGLESSAEGSGTRWGLLHVSISALRATVQGVRGGVDRR